MISVKPSRPSGTREDCFHVSFYGSARLACFGVLGGTRSDMKKIIRVFVAPICTASTAAQTESASASVKRVESIVSKMSLEEKIDYIGGTGFAIRAMPNLHLPAFEMSDGPLGVRSNSRFPFTVYAAGIGLAATWNPSLAELLGGGIGQVTVGDCNGSARSKSDVSKSSTVFGKGNFGFGAAIQVIENGLGNTALRHAPEVCDVDYSGRVHRPVRHNPARISGRDG